MARIDYVAGWYFKAAEFMQGTDIKTAFVSTNSITQGEQVSAIWEPLYDRFCIHIDFAWRTFKWSSESTDQAAVHCVIIGFSFRNTENKRYLYLNDKTVKSVKNINPYLMSAPNVFVQNRTTPICSAPKMLFGNMPRDNGNLILSEDEKNELIKREPLAEKFIRPFMMGKEFLNRTPPFLFMVS